RELRSRGASEDECIEFALRYREQPDASPLGYRLVIGERDEGPFVAEEHLAFVPGQSRSVAQLMSFRNGSGEVWTANSPSDGRREEIELASPETLAVSSLGQLRDHPRALALREFVTGWYLSNLSADSVRNAPQAGSQERLSQSGDNLANVLQYLEERYPEVLQRVHERLTARVPRLESVETTTLHDGRLMLQVKDAPFERPIVASYASDGTLKLLAYLLVLHDPDPPPLVGIEEPENHIHPRLLPELAEECRLATRRSQLIITTHSPHFLHGVLPEQAWALYRDEDGYTQATRTADMELVPRMMEHGASLGNLWMEGFFDVGDPLTNAGASRVIRVGKGRTDAC
ncbi:MAG: AAA family ATPase, partial [Armatimonadota bacterium]